MTPRFLHRFLLAIIATLASINMSAVRGDGPILFVSSFAKGEAGGIQALRLSSEDGGLLPLARTGGIENPFFLAVSPDGRFLYAVHAETFGGKDDEEVAAFAINRDTGSLTLLNRQSAKGTATCYLEVDATGKTLLLGGIPRKESISTLPEEFEGSSYCADLKFTPDGRFLYGTNRGHDSLAIFRAGEDGVLTRVGIVPSLGKGPQNLLVTPDGKWLLCANMPGNNLAVFRIDGETGNLTSAGAPLEISMPSCIRILP